MKNVHIDVDCSSDDITAAIFLATQPNIKIVGITVAATGEAHGQQGAENMADLFEVMGKENIPVAYGNENSYDSLGTPFPDDLRKLIDGILVTKNIPKKPDRKFPLSAVELLAKVLQENEKVSILATGPLTNIAQLIQTHSGLLPKIEKIFIMGGAIIAKGNIKALLKDSENTEAEWNIFADPKAADIVFASKLPIVLVPLDATNQVPMTEKFYYSLSTKLNPLLQLIYLLLKDIV